MTRGPLLFCAVLLGWFILASSMTAGADGGTNDVGACTSTGRVWLLVVDETGHPLANQCVGTPASGTSALAAGGLPFQTSRGVICSVAGNPPKCPRTFRGQFWHYWHAEAGGPWVFSEHGPSARTPGPGSLEGWCYNAEDERRCTPPRLRVLVEGAELGTGTDLAELPTTTNQPVDESATTGSPGALLATGAVLAAGGVGFLIWSRRRPRP